MNLIQAAAEYREAYYKALAVRKPLEEMNEAAVWPKSHKLSQGLLEVQKEMVKLQGIMLGRARAYPKRGQWRRLKQLQAKVEQFEKEIVAAKVVESAEWKEHSASWSRAILLSNDALQKADRVLAAALED